MAGIQIVDLDNCLSDDRWRRPFIDKKLPLAQRYDEYHKGMLLDSPANVDQIRRNDDIVVITGRPVSYHKWTLSWIQTKLWIQPLHLIMRNNNDYRNAVEVKADALTWLFDRNMYGIRLADVVDAIDDRLDIIEMYKAKFGLPARVVGVDIGDGTRNEDCS
jgi:hypothetical protein